MEACSDTLRLANKNPFFYQCTVPPTNSGSIYIAGLAVHVPRQYPLDKVPTHDGTTGHGFLAKSGFSKH